MSKPSFSITRKSVVSSMKELKANMAFVTEAPALVPGLLIDAADHAFSEHGPAHHRLGQFRPFQLESAKGLARFAQEQHDTNRRLLNQRVFIQEQRAGIGKTIVVGVVLGFDALLNGNRGLVSTNTRALRTSY